MTTKVLIPKPGMGTTDATIAKWLKKEGDTVMQGEVIAELETAKAMQEIEAPVTGVLTKILLQAGETAEVYAEMAIIEESAKDS